MADADLRERAIALIITKTITAPHAARAIVGAVSDAQVQALLDAEHVAPRGLHVQAALDELRQAIAAQKAEVDAATQRDDAPPPPPTLAAE